MKGKGKGKRDNGGSGRGSMLEAHRDLEESKQSVKQLLKLRRSLYGGDPSKVAKIEEYREKAIEALNNLFEDELRDAG
jgi:hypothetical protein